MSNSRTPTSIEDFKIGTIIGLKDNPGWKAIIIEHRKMFIRGKTVNNWPMRKVITSDGHPFEGSLGKVNSAFNIYLIIKSPKIEPSEEVKKTSLPSTTKYMESLLP